MMTRRLLLTLLFAVSLLNVFGRDNKWNNDLFSSSSFIRSLNITNNNEYSEETFRRKPRKIKKARKSLKKNRKKFKTSKRKLKKRKSNNRKYSQARALSGVDFYTNSYGRTVQSPTRYSSRPPGATALCRDGTYSFSLSRRGACSGHGGVAVWY